MQRPTRHSQLERLLEESARRTAVALKVPERFVDFCEWIGVTLTPVQRIFCLVAYDGMQPDDFEGEDRANAERLFGGLFRVSESMLATIFALCGGRAGKTYVMGSLRLVWGAYVRDLTSLAPGQRAVALSVAPKDIHRQEIINFQLGAVRSRPELKATIVSPRYLKDDDAPSEFAIRRPDGHIVTFEGGTANRGGYGGRGRSLTDCLMDEAAFFQDSLHVVNDQEIFKAASPRVLPGGQMIVPTTAWAKSGFHYEQWRENFGHPVTSLAVHATTEMLRPAAAPMVARERLRDPENARREFDAEPMGDTAVTFFGEDTISACLDVGLVFPAHITPADPYHPELRASGSDFGFRSNSSTQAIVHKIYAQIVLAALHEWRPEPGLPLKPSVTASAQGDVCREHGVHATMADGHYSETVREFLGRKVGLIAAPTVPSEVFVRVRTLMRDGRLRLPDPTNLPEPYKSLVMRLIKQLRETRGQPTAGGGYTITLPRWPDGSHGDLVVGLCNAAYQFGGEPAEAAAPKAGTEDWEDAERARRRAALRSKR